MKLSAPIYRLKRLAKSISRQEKIPLHAALDKVAQSEGFRHWSLLVARATTIDPSTEILKQITPGELVLLGARPGHGKTLMGLNLLTKSLKDGKHGWFFTLEWNKADVDERLQFLGEERLCTSNRFHFDGSDSISSDYIIKRLANAKSGTVAVIDYLQLLDQKRSNPDLSEQVSDLKFFAQRQSVSIICISQVDRSYDNSDKRTPSLSDIRLPNPLDLTLFDRACFLHNGRVECTHVR